MCRIVKLMRPFAGSMLLGLSTICFGQSANPTTGVPGKPLTTPVGKTATVKPPARCFTQSPRPSLCIQITGPGSVIKVGASLPLNVVVTNISNHDVLFGVGSVRSPGIRVLDTGNHLAPRTAYGRKIHRLPTGGSVFGLPLNLGAGKQESWTTDIAKEYDLTKPGKYTVQDLMHDPDEPTRMLKSNAITLTVTPK